VASTRFAKTATLNGLTCSTPSGQCGLNLLLPPMMIPSGEKLDFRLQANLLVPEPSTALLLTVGLVGLGVRGRRRGA
jgi:hypothetical protein